MLHTEIWARSYYRSRNGPETAVSPELTPVWGQLMKVGNEEFINNLQVAQQAGKHPFQVVHEHPPKITLPNF